MLKKFSAPPACNTAPPLNGSSSNTANTELETTLLVHPTLFPDFDVFNDML
ncbi:hypothetical protein NM133_0793, partial [Neisseria meningitidis NM133]